MIDRFKVYAKGGDGGSGCHSTRRSRHDRHGQPDGMLILLSNLLIYTYHLVITMISSFSGQFCVKKKERFV